MEKPIDLRIDILETKVEAIYQHLEKLDKDVNYDIRKIHEDLRSIKYDLEKGVGMSEK